MRPAMAFRGGPVARGSGRRLAGVGIALAAAALTVTGCSHVLPLGPTTAAQRQLASPVVLQIVLSQPSLAGSCPAGYTRLPGPGADDPGATDGPDGCYRKTGAPVTITSAAVTYFQQPAANQQPAMYGVNVTLPASEAAALTAITTTAYHSQNSLATIVGGKTWSIAGIGDPFTGGQFVIPAQNTTQALQLLRTLIPSS
jgi:hypothetical protein